MTGGLKIPDVAYMSYGPTLGVDVPLGSPTFSAGLHFTYLLTSGDSKNAPGDATLTGTWGLDFGLHLDYLPLPWLLARAQFGLTRYSSSFDAGAGTLTTSASDMYVGGLLTVGYVY